MNNDEKKKQPKAKRRYTPQGHYMWEAFGGEEIAELHPYGWVYVSEGTWVDRNGNFYYD
jgi:hypothetical protein